MKKQHFIIPVFIPEKACPKRCIFCDQYLISGNISQPSTGEVMEKIEKYLDTFPQGSKIEIGFFGGNFTGIPQEQQRAYLQVAQTYIDKGNASSIRISTRPDYIDEDTINLLKKYSVQTIEIGAQSFSDEVLQLSERGHMVSHIYDASAQIKKAGFSLGLQMMIGLPGDTIEKALFTAREIIRLGAESTRIYPTLVIRNTKLAKLWKQGDYKPLSLEAAVDVSKMLLLEFERANVNVLRIGLHPSEGLLSGRELLDGPFHQAFGELVQTVVWRGILDETLSLSMIEEGGGKRCKNQQLSIEVAPAQLNAAIGHKSANRRYFETRFKSVRFLKNPSYTGRQCSVKIE